MSENKTNRYLMKRVNVVVSGPGETFGDVMLIIQEALDKAGIETLVKDDYPCPEDWARQKVENRFVTLVADHQPWGG